MKVLIVHNYYGDFSLGGEAIVFNEEAELLKNNGVQIFKYERSNSEILKMSLLGKVKALFKLYWSQETLEQSGAIMDQFKPDILHVHNYKYLITPSIFQAAKLRGIKTVLTLHNYRLMVPCGNFMTRKGKVCDRCMTKNPVNILLRRCTEGSLFKSYLHYRLFIKTRDKLHQLTDLVDAYIVLSDFARVKLVQTGVPEDRIHIKPNFVRPLLPNDNVVSKYERAVYIGRLSYEKGCLQLIDYWSEINYPLYIIGGGPLQGRARLLATTNPNIIFLGDMTNEKVKEFLMQSSFLIFPSIIYETMGLSILEAMSVGIPVIATDLGPRREIVSENITGLLYNPDNLIDFKNKVFWLIENKRIRLEMGAAARRIYSKKYSPEINYNILLNIYSNLINRERI